MSDGCIEARGTVVNWGYRDGQEWLDLPNSSQQATLTRTFSNGLIVASIVNFWATYLVVYLVSSNDIRKSSGRLNDHLLTTTEQNRPKEQYT